MLMFILCLNAKVVLWKKCSVNIFFKEHNEERERESSWNVSKKKWQNATDVRSFVITMKMHICLIMAIFVEEHFALHHQLHRSPQFIWFAWWWFCSASIRNGSFLFRSFRSLTFNSRSKRASTLNLPKKEQHHTFPEECKTKWIPILNFSFQHHFLHCQFPPFNYLHSYFFPLASPFIPLLEIYSRWAFSLVSFTPIHAPNKSTDFVAYKYEICILKISTMIKLFALTLKQPEQMQFTEYSWNWKVCFDKFNNKNKLQMQYSI